MNTFLKLDKFMCLLVIVFLASCEQSKEGVNEGLIGYWELSGDAVDRSGNDLQTEVHGAVSFESEDGAMKGGSAVFDGRGSWLEVQPSQALALGEGDFS